jgi:hypothetical protein
VQQFPIFAVPLSIKSGAFEVFRPGFRNKDDNSAATDIAHAFHATFALQGDLWGSSFFLNQVRTKHNVPKTSKPWTSKPGVVLRGVPDSDRMRDVIDTCFAVERSKAPDMKLQDLLCGLIVDVSQQVNRQPWSRIGRTALPSSILYSFEHDSTLSGAASMKLLGWPSRCLPFHKFSDKEFANLGGESYSLIWATVFHGLMFTNPWGEWWQKKK